MSLMMSAPSSPFHVYSPVVCDGPELHECECETDRLMEESWTEVKKQPCTDTREHHRTCVLPSNSSSSSSSSSGSCSSERVLTSASSPSQPAQALSKASVPTPAQLAHVNAGHASARRSVEIGRELLSLLPQADQSMMSRVIEGGSRGVTVMQKAIDSAMSLRGMVDSVAHLWGQLPGFEANFYNLARGIHDIYREGESLMIVYHEGMIEIVRKDSKVGRDTEAIRMMNEMECDLDSLRSSTALDGRDGIDRSRLLDRLEGRMAELSSMTHASNPHSRASQVSSQAYVEISFWRSVWNRLKIFFGFHPKRSD
jgi:hypothetical protein